MRADAAPGDGKGGRVADGLTEGITWLSTKEAAARLGVTLRSLYRFIDEGDLVAYKFGRVIRLQQADVDRFIEASRIEPGSLEHLYPEVKRPTARPSRNGLSAARPA